MVVNMGGSRNQNTSIKSGNGNKNASKLKSDAFARQVAKEMVKLMEMESEHGSTNNSAPISKEEVYKVAQSKAGLNQDKMKACAAVIEQRRGSSTTFEEDTSNSDVWHPDFWAGAEVEDIMRLEKRGFIKPQNTGGENLLGFLKTLEDISARHEDPSSIGEHSTTSGMSKRSTKLREMKIGNRHSSTTATSSCLKRSGQRKREVTSGVSFARVAVRSYTRSLSDNPACTNGPSIGIGWTYEPETVYSVDEWEKRRGRVPRHSSKLVLSREAREAILREDVGCSQQEIARALRAINKVRSQRHSTATNLKNQSIEETVEMARRKMKRILLLNRA